jgi:phage tail-like protein
MATERNRPYSQFNFRVSWMPATGSEGDTLDEQTVQAGFQEVSGLGMEITVAEYRAGNAATNEPIKITGTVKTPDVTLKRGVIGSTDLYDWLHEVRNGSQNQLKNVSIKLMAEDRETVAQQWKLFNSRPMKYTGPSLNGKGTDLAIEELVLAAERIVLE